MTPSEAIEKLRAAGRSEQSIAAAVATSQPTINRIRKGQEPNYALGKALIDLAGSLEQAAPDAEGLPDAA